MAGSINVRWHAAPIPAGHGRGRKESHRTNQMAWIDELLDHTLVLVAHPDDECIAFGALLQRIQLSAGCIRNERISG